VARSGSLNTTIRAMPVGVTVSTAIPKARSVPSASRRTRGRLMLVDRVSESISHRVAALPLPSRLQESVGGNALHLAQSG
jgi:hypothetical protein